jgi:hypothetical protein
MVSGSRRKILPEPVSGSSAVGHHHLRSLDVAAKIGHALSDFMVHGMR